MKKSGLIFRAPDGRAKNLGLEYQRLKKKGFFQKIRNFQADHLKWFKRASYETKVVSLLKIWEYIHVSNLALIKTKRNLLSTL